MKTCNEYAHEAIRPFLGTALEIYTDAISHEKDGKIRLVLRAFVDPVRDRVEQQVRASMREAYTAGYQAAVGELRRQEPRDPHDPFECAEIRRHRLLIGAVEEQANMALADSGIR